MLVNNMDKVCSYCKVKYGHVDCEPLFPGAVSHGVCSACDCVENDKLDKQEEKKITKFIWEFVC